MSNHRNGKSYGETSTTPEEIVALIGNIANRPDIWEVQERQVKEIYALIKEFEDIAKEWKKGYEDMEKSYKVRLRHAEQVIETLREDLKDEQLKNK